MSSPLFVVGAQRSGSTALAYALSEAFDRKGGCFTVNGKLLYYARRWITVDDVRAQHLRTDEILHALARKPATGRTASKWMERVEWSLREAARRVANEEVPATREGVCALVRGLALDGYPTAPWGDKYNEYLLDLEFLHEIFPGAKWLFLSRHPGEVRESTHAWTGDRPWRPRTDEAIERRWVEWNVSWLSFRERVKPGRRLEVKYAELCSGRAADAIGRFADVDLQGLVTMRRPLGDPPMIRTNRAQDMWTTLTANSLPEDI